MHHLKAHVLFEVKSLPQQGYGWAKTKRQRLSEKMAILPPSS